MENTSGQGKAAIVPPEIDRWNWGAFLLNWIWGIGNNTFIALLMFVPLANMVMPFVLGAKGSIWAWQNKRWQDIEEFRSVQRKWAKWGLIVVCAFILVSAGLFFVAEKAFRGLEPNQIAIARIEKSERVSALIGAPVSTGFPMGHIEVSGPNGSASLSISVAGPKGRGTVYVEESRKLGRWRIDRMVFEDESGQRIDLTR